MCVSFYLSMRPGLVMHVPSAAELCIDNVWGGSQRLIVAGLSRIIIGGVTLCMSDRYRSQVPACMLTGPWLCCSSQHCWQLTGSPTNGCGTHTQSADGKTTNDDEEENEVVSACLTCCFYKVVYHRRSSCRTIVVMLTTTWVRPLPGH